MKVGTRYPLNLRLRKDFFFLMIILKSCVDPLCNEYVEKVFKKSEVLYQIVLSEYLTLTEDMQKTSDHWLVKISFFHQNLWNQTLTVEWKVRRFVRSFELRLNQNMVKLSLLFIEIVRKCFLYSIRGNVSFSHIERKFFLQFYI